jgi:glucose/arabinose dehydrogenase
MYVGGCTQKPPDPEPDVLPKVALTEAYPRLSFAQPLEYVSPADGSDRVFIVEKPGRILVFANDQQVTNAAVFLDLRSKVDSTGFEQGLLGLAFHPRFASNGLFYINYTASGQSVIAEYRADPDNPNQALPASARILLTIRQPYTNHNGGHLAFGPDGFLYIGMGDGGSAGDPQGNAQNMKSLLGKMLRIDVDRADAGRAYAIPPDNPWAGNQQDYREEIYALGLRNPWKFSFDLPDGLLWVADVGQDSLEEINIVAKGLNYGWNRMEGTACYPPGSQCSAEGLQLPVWEYRHPIGQSITGGYVYRGTAIKGLAGYYVYGDYVTGRIWALRIDASAAPTNHLLLESGLRISSFGVNQAGELYVVDFRGKVYKLTAVGQ